jgi:hypothetical protein
MDESNPMQAPQAPQAPVQPVAMPGVPASPLAVPAAPDINGALSKSHDLAKTMFDKTSADSAQIQETQDKLDGLIKLGDSVTPDDVIKVAGDMVASGSASPTEMAQYLSDMPSNGQAIAVWLQQHMQQNQQALQHVSQMKTIARHELGTSALRMLLHGQVPTDGAPGGPVAPPAPGNALAPAPMTPGGSPDAT